MIIIYNKKREHNKFSFLDREIFIDERDDLKLYYYWKMHLLSFVCCGKCLNPSRDVALLNTSRSFASSVQQRTSPIYIYTRIMNVGYIMYRGGCLSHVLSPFLLYISIFFLSYPHCVMKCMIEQPGQSSISLVFLLF